MKKILAIFTVAVILCLSVLSVTAATTHDNNKESLQSYAGQGKLTCTEETVLDFDDINQFYFTWKGTIDYADKKEGDGSLAVDLSTENPPANFKPNCFETRDGSFKTTVTDIRKQTFKFWVYINDIDNIVCDHDSVHENAQKGSGTLYISLATSSKKDNELFVNHTLEGSGWHLVEFDLNVNWDYTKYYGEKIDIGYMKVYVEALPGLEMKFDDLKKVTYKNDGYTAPALENNGRWISTCDFDSIDGSIVSEWYGSSFDTSEKTQGSSSLQMRGRKIHEDYRVVWSGLNVPYDKAKDVLHFDFYIEDMATLGDHFEQRMCLADTVKRCDCENWLYYTYAHLQTYSNNRKGLQNGWNSIDIPLKVMTGNFEAAEDCKATDHEWRIVSNLMFWQGASADKYYVIKYDNMYLYEGDISAIMGSGNNTTADSTDVSMLSDAKTAEIAEKIFKDTANVKLKGYSDADIKKITAKFNELYPNYTFTVNEDGSVTCTENKDDNLILYIAIGGGALLLIIIVVVLIIVLKRKKKTKSE
ncbi:MAG: hypothetical protein IJ462_03495 [Clostridia bacterium]|nr:hypothetical protein [Clostridia bacterium]